MLQALTFKSASRFSKHCRICHYQHYTAVGNNFSWFESLPNNTVSMSVIETLYQQCSTYTATCGCLAKTMFISYYHQLLLSSYWNWHPLSYQYSNWISLICLFALCSGHFRCLFNNLNELKID